MGKSVRNTKAPAENNQAITDPENVINSSIRYREMDVEIKKGDGREIRKVQVGISVQKETVESLQERRKLAEDHLKIADPANQQLVEALNKAIAAIDARKAKLPTTPQAAPADNK